MIYDNTNAFADPFKKKNLRTFFLNLNEQFFLCVAFCPRIIQRTSQNSNIVRSKFQDFKILKRKSKFLKKNNNKPVALPVSQLTIDLWHYLSAVYGMPPVIFDPRTWGMLHSVPELLPLPYTYACKQMKQECFILHQCS